MKKYIFAIAALIFSQVALADPASIWIFSGKDALNAGSRVKHFGRTYQVEQESDFGHIRWRLGYDNEGTLPCKSLDRGCKRDGIYAMPVAIYHFTDRLETSASGGMYLFDETHEDQYSYSVTHGAAMIAALGATYQPTKWIAVQARFQHIEFASDSRSVDQFLVGVGFTPANW